MLMVMGTNFHNGASLLSMAIKECTDCHQATAFGTFFTKMAIMVMNNHGAPWAFSLYSLL